MKNNFEGYYARRQSTRAAWMVRLLEHVRNESLEGRSVSGASAARLLGISDHVAGELLRSLEREGEVIRLGRLDGWTIRSAVDSPRYAALEEFLTLARNHTSPAASPPKGRQASSPARQLHAITPGQLEDIQRVCRLIARYLTLAGNPEGHVPSFLLRWDRDLPGGGGWALTEAVRVWSEAEHRKRFGAQSQRSSDASVSKAVGAVNALMYLAATHGMITAETRANGNFHYFAVWAHRVARTARHVQRHHKVHVRKLRLGLRQLAMYASGQGATSFRTTNWDALRLTIESDRSCGTLSEDLYTAARYAWRHTCRSLPTGVRISPRLAWTTQRDLRRAAVGTRAIRLAAAPPHDFSLWSDDSGRPFTALVEGDFGVRNYVLWASVSDARLQALSDRLPPRVWDQLPKKPTRRASRVRPTALAEPTLRTRLSHLMNLAGFATRVLGRDPSSLDLRHLCSPEQVVLPFVAAESERGGDDALVSSINSTIWTVIWLLNGFLIGKAVLLASLKRSQGDDVTADQHEQEAQTFRRWYRQLEEHAALRPSEQSRDGDAVKRRVNAIARGWSGTDGVPGLVKIGMLTRLLIEDAGAAVGGRTLEEMIAAIEAGDFQPTAEWASLVRLAAVLNLGHIVPLRGGTFASLTMDMWRIAPATPSQTRRSLAPWEGAIMLDIPAKIMKQRRPFTPALILKEHVVADDQPGLPAAEAAIGRPLLKLWFMKGGAREFCSSRRNGRGGDRSLVDTRWLFPDLYWQDHGANASGIGLPKVPRLHGQWTTHRLSNQFRTAVRRHASALNLDLQLLDATYGAMGIHSLRRLFGSYHARIDPVACSLMLGHKNMQFTVAIYTAQDESRVVLLPQTHS